MKRTVSRLVATLLFLACGGISAASPYSDAVLSDNPILYYQFEELDGTTAVDSSPTGADGTYIGGVQLQQASGKASLGSSVSFDGVSGWIDVPALGSFPQVTIETWLNLEGDPAGGCCTSLYSTDSWSIGNIHFNIKSGRDVEHAVNSGGPNNSNTPGGVIESNTWYHLVATYDSTAGGDTHIYIDGEEMSNLPHASAPLASLVDAQIAGWNGARFFDGRMDEFAIYDSVLDVGRVQAHFEAADTVFLPADLNNSGFVDFEDLTILLSNWNKDVSAAEGNLVKPLVTVVNFDDLTVLLAEWTGPGAASPEAALGEAVPEPSSLLLALLATLGLSFCRRRRRRAF